MKEIKYNTQIGDEINVTVLFDYVPAQAETVLDDACDADLTINEILVDGDEGKDILEVLSDVQVEILSQDCEEYLLD
jgi:hypothetical protein